MAPLSRTVDETHHIAPAIKVLSTELHLPQQGSVYKHPAGQQYVEFHGMMPEITVQRTRLWPHF
jgi:hypothetical protein